MKQVLVSGIRISCRKAASGMEKLLRRAAAEQLRLPEKEISGITVVSRSIDARKKEPVLELRLAVSVPDDAPFPEYREKAPVLDLPEKHLCRDPIVVGTGPAGIFAALVFALAGCRPLILDRGEDVDARSRRQLEFLKNRRLDENSNLLIGEGGSGTFSDGKLYTGTRDPRGRFVLHELVSAGAPEEILVLARPHVGTDYLKTAAAGLRKKIESLGGVFRFNTCVEDIVVENGKCRGVVLASGEVLESNSVVIACGLGGRGLARKLAEKVRFSLKPFQIGCRIEHPQEMIDRVQYHGSRPELLGAAEYHIVSRPQDGKTLQVSSFCMCPGGEVVNATAWKEQCVTNGMSSFARAGKYANSCLISTVRPELYGSLDDVFEMIRHIGHELFVSGGSDYTFPAQDAEAFLRGEKRLSRPGESSCQTGIVPGDVSRLLPKENYLALVSALKYFDRKMSGFIRYGKIIGVENCVSSPLRFDRDELGFSSVHGLMLCGEGAGFAGGIVSAACDGIRCAENMLKNLC